jgi:hypothetical protein
MQRKPLTAKVGNIYGLVLEHFGFGARFIHMIRTMYVNLSIISTGTTHSNPFIKQRGCKQDCHAIPYAICSPFDLLAQSICQKFGFLTFHNQAN